MRKYTKTRPAERQMYRAFALIREGRRGWLWRHSSLAGAEGRAPSLPEAAQAVDDWYASGRALTFVPPEALPAPVWRPRAAALIWATGAWALLALLVLVALVAWRIV